jgi:hypothetical protein
MMALLSYSLVSTIILFGVLLSMLELGRRLGLRAMQSSAGTSHEGVGAVEAAVFGLLLAFTFTSAASRFDARREMLVDEANALGTAYLRLDVLPENARAELKQELRAYVDLRLASYRSATKAERDAIAQKELAAQARIWSAANAALPGEGRGADRNLLLPALNEVFDAASKRIAAQKFHIPGVIFALLCSLAIFSALLAGFGMAKAQRRQWLHKIVLAMVLALTIYTILDLEFPRAGLIRMDDLDVILRQTRDEMK